MYVDVVELKGKIGVCSLEVYLPASIFILAKIFQSFQDVGQNFDPISK